MKTEPILLIVLSLLVLGSSPSGAVPFSDTLDFGGSRKFKGSTYATVGDVSPFSLDYGLEDAAQGRDLASGSFTLTYSQVSPSSRAERWAVMVGGQTLGHLEGGRASRWYSQTFVLSSDLVAGINSGLYPLEIVLQESTRGRDKLILDRIAFSWDFLAPPSPGGPTPLPQEPQHPDPGPWQPQAPAPVPEPSTLLLMGAGLGGLACFRKKLRLP